MTQNVEALHLGDGRIFVGKQYVGQVRATSVQQTIAEVEHESNFGLEYFTDHIVTIRRGYDVSWTFEEINPKNANMMLAMPGFSGVPFNRSLPGPRLDPSLVAASSYVHTIDMICHLLNDTDGIGQYSPLMYEVCNADLDSLVLSIPEIVVNNIDFTGVVNGYKAICITCNSSENDDLESLPSNIQIIPYTETADDFEITIRNVNPLTGSPLEDEFTVYMADCSIMTDGEFQFDSIFAQFPNFVGYAPGGDVPLLIDGYTASDLAFDEALNAVEPPTPITVHKAATGQIVSVEGNEITWGTTGYEYSWPQDFLYENNKAVCHVKMTAGSSITAGEPLKVTWSYNTLNIRELPFSSSGKNPIVPIVFDILFPDNESRMIWTFFKARMQTSLRFATSGNDWTGQDMTCRTLDASNKYPKYGYGYLQFTGPLVEQIMEYGNTPFGVEKILGKNQTSFA